MKKEDYFNKNKIDYIDYKDVEVLKKYLTPHARIQSRRRSGVATVHQRGLSTAVKRARFLGLLPYVTR